MNILAPTHTYIQLGIIYSALNLACHSWLCVSNMHQGPGPRTQPCLARILASQSSPACVPWPTCCAVAAQRQSLQEPHPPASRWTKAWLCISNLHITCLMAWLACSSALRMLCTHLGTCVHVHHSSVARSDKKPLCKLAQPEDTMLPHHKVERQVAALATGFLELH